MFKINKITDEDIHLKIRYSYVVSLEKIDSFSAELLKFKYDKKLLLYIKDFIKEINDDIYSKDNRKKTIELENELLNNTEFLNLEIIFYAFNKLFKKRITKKAINTTTILEKKAKLNSNLNSRSLITRLEYKKIIDKLDAISLVLFINYAVKNIQQKSDL